MHLHIRFKRQRSGFGWIVSTLRPGCALTPGGEEKQ